MSGLVSDVMLAHPKTQGSDTTVDEIRELFKDEKVLMALVVGDDGKLLTTIERQDVPAAGSLAAEIGTLTGRTVHPSDSVDEVTAKAGETWRRLAVVDDDGHLVGLLCQKRDRSGFCSV